MQSIAVALSAALAVLALQPPVAFAQPIRFRAELPLSGPEVAPVTVTSGPPHVATNGDGYAAIWTDLRSGEPRAYAARFTQDGSVLDPLGIRIAGADFAGPIVWTGSTYVLIYGDGLRVYTRTLDANGSLGTPVELLVRQSDAAVEIAAASNGQSVLVVGASLPGLLLDVEGRVQRQIPFPWDYPFRGVGVAAAANGNYLVVAGANDGAVQLVRADGSLGPMQTISGLTPSSRFAIGSSGNQFVAVWSGEDLRSRAYDSNGGAIGEPHTIVAGGASTVPSIGWGDGEYLVTWSEDYGSVRSTRLSADGVALSAPTVTTARSNQPAAIARRGAVGVAMWRNRSGILDAALFDGASLTSSEPFTRVVPIANAAARQWDVKLARLSQGAIVAGWIESHDQNGELRLSFGPASESVVAADAADRLVEVLVLNDVLWVVFAQSTNLYAQRFDAKLSRIDPEPITIAQGTYSDPASAVAAAGERTVLCVFTVPDEKSTESVSDLRAALLRPEAGTVSVTSVGIPSGAFEDHHPAVAYDGRAFVVHWARSKAATPDNHLLPPPADDVVSVDVVDFIFVTATQPRVVYSSPSAIRTIFGARGARGVAFIWQNQEDVTSLMYTDEVAQTRSLGAAADKGIVGAFEAHGNDFIAVAATSTFTGESYLQEFEAITLGTGGISAGIPLGTFEAHNEWRTPDVDILGGSAPFLAYARLATESAFGGVSRIYAQLSTSLRRRSVR